jgi:hypothetical protein
MFVLIALSIPSYASKSVYVINDTLTSRLKAYKVEGSSLVWQKDYVCHFSRGGGEFGAVGLAIDESEYGQFLFVTFELSDEIEVVNANTMQYVDSVRASGATDLAGIEMDVGKRKLYTVDRKTNHLYSYSWDPVSKRLVPEYGYPYYIVLEGISNLLGKGAFGIALDETHSRLYVADNTKKVKYYNTNTWSHSGNIPPTSDANCNVISVAIDVPNQLLYYGSMGDYGQGNTHLYQYNLSSGTPGKSVDIACSVAGIAVDQSTGLVYLTTYGGSGDANNPLPKDRLMVYDFHPPTPHDYGIPVI